MFKSLVAAISVVLICLISFSLVGLLVVVISLSAPLDESQSRALLIGLAVLLVVICLAALLVRWATALYSRRAHELRRDMRMAARLRVPRAFFTEQERRVREWEDSMNGINTNTSKNTGRANSVQDSAEERYRPPPLQQRPLVSELLGDSRLITGSSSRSSGANSSDARHETPATSSATIEQVAEEELPEIQDASRTEEQQQQQQQQQHDEHNQQKEHIIDEESNATVESNVRSSKVGLRQVRELEELLSITGQALCYLPPAVVPLLMRTQNSLATPRLFTARTCTCLHIDWQFDWNSFAFHCPASSAHSGDGDGSQSLRSRSLGSASSSLHTMRSSTASVEQQLEQSIVTSSEPPSDEDVSCRLERFLSVVMRALLRHGAVVDSMRGDSIVCAFNLKVDQDATARRPEAAAAPAPATTRVEAEAETAANSSGAAAEQQNENGNPAPAVSEGDLGPLRAAFCALYLCALSRMGRIDGDFTTTTTLPAVLMNEGGGGGDEQQQQPQQHQQRIVRLKHPPAVLRCGIDCGPVRFGCIGANELRRVGFAIASGHCVERAGSLAKACRLFGTSVLASQAVAKVVEHFVMSRCVVFARFSSEKWRPLQREDQQQGGRAHPIFELIGCLPVSVPPRTGGVSTGYALTQQHGAAIYGDDVDDDDLARVDHHTRRCHSRKTTRPARKKSSSTSLSSASSAGTPSLPEDSFAHIISIGTQQNFEDDDGDDDDDDDGDGPAAKRSRSLNLAMIDSDESSNSSFSSSRSSSSVMMLHNPDVMPPRTSRSRSSSSVPRFALPVRSPRDGDLEKRVRSPGDDDDSSDGAARAHLVELFAKRDAAANSTAAAAAAAGPSLGTAAVAISSASGEQGGATEATARRRQQQRHQQPTNGDNENSLLRCLENMCCDDADEKREQEEDEDDLQQHDLYDESFEVWDIAFLTKKQLQLTVVSLQDIAFAEHATEAAVCLYNKKIDECLVHLEQAEAVRGVASSPYAAAATSSSATPESSLERLRSYALRANRSRRKMKGDHFVVDL